MKIHEYQARELFADYGVPVPRGSMAESPGEVARIAIVGEVTENLFWQSS
jgi:succinyl-CoA synthetase beta subunit